MITRCLWNCLIMYFQSLISFEPAFHCYLFALITSVAGEWYDGSGSFIVRCSQILIPCHCVSWKFHLNSASSCNEMPWMNIITCLLPKRSEINGGWVQSQWQKQLVSPMFCPYLPETSNITSKISFHSYQTEVYTVLIALTLTLTQYT